MCSSASVSESVYSLAGLCKNYSTNCHKIQWKGSTWAMEEAIRVTLGLQLQLGGVPPHIYSAQNI